MRILLVEDEPGIADFIRQGLTESAYAVDVAFDGLEGLDYAISAEYDILVLDIMLPKLNGLDLMAELRRRGQRTPTFMLTARDTVDDRVAGLDAGAREYAHANALDCPLGPSSGGPYWSLDGWTSAFSHRPNYYHGRGD